jgi:hypothetical protein
LGDHAGAPPAQTAPPAAWRLVDAGSPLLRVAPPLAGLRPGDGLARGRSGVGAPRAGGSV